MYARTHTEHRLDALEARADHRIASRAEPGQAGPLRSQPTANLWPVAVTYIARGICFMRRHGLRACDDPLRRLQWPHHIRRHRQQHTRACDWAGGDSGQLESACKHWHWVSVAQCCVVGMFRDPSGPRSRRSSIASHQRSHTPHYSPMLRPQQISWRCAAPSS
jgi:hypothetical protein